MPRFPLIAALVALIVIALLAPTIAAPRSTAPASTPPSIAAVSPLQGNGWTIRLNNGETFFVEIRALDTGGRGPKPGPIKNFRDQQVWLGLEAGYATFEQAGIPYHARRP